MSEKRKAFRRGKRVFYEDGCPLRILNLRAFEKLPDRKLDE
jgi:hypothetical protein